MKKSNHTSVLAIGLLIAAWCNAQTVSITGTVTDSSTAAPMQAVSVVIKGGITGTITNAKGKFHLTAKVDLPVHLIVSYAEYGSKEVAISEKTAEIAVQLAPSYSISEGVVLSPNRSLTKNLESAVSVETINWKKIVNSPAISYYNAAATLKGVDVTTSGMLFNTISTRGFNGSGSTRVNQLVDGMDNQAPGLNFFVGNFVGLTELDVDNIEILPGASSALYGPGGINGTVLITSKDPFKEGLSFQARQGVMQLGKSGRGKASPFFDYSLRWAKAFNNKFAFKIGAQYISADDWLADDSSNYKRIGNANVLVPGNRQTDPAYDGVNVYGDETKGDLTPLIEGAILQNPELAGPLAPFRNKPFYVSRTGYAEKDVIDPKTRNIKLSGALHYKINNKLEAQLMGYWATGNTVYTGSNRYVLKDIKIGQYKAELKHKDWFLRTYTTQENAGEAYTATAAMQVLNEAWKPSLDKTNLNGSWFPQYFGAFATGAVTVFQTAYAGAVSGGKTPQEAYAIAQSTVEASASQLHQAGRAYADQGRPLPGTQPYNQLFDQVRKTPIPNGGLFKEKSQLWMTEGQYNFSRFVKFADVVAGANWKKYILDSDGTLFIDTLQPITINEMGAYAQVSKSFFADVVTLSASGRYDKNEDFKGRFTPRFTALVKLTKNNNLRFSYQTAYRFPSTQQKYIRLNVGDAILLGGLPWIMDYMHAKDGDVVEVINGVPQSTPYVYKEFKPESCTSFEIGYKAAFAEKFLIDAYGYWGEYKDFLGRNILLKKSTGQVYSTAVNSPQKVKTHGFGLGIDYNVYKKYSLFFNAYTDVITKVPAGFQSYFNTPKYRLNAGFGNSGLGKKRQTGFNITLHWQDSFMWDGELANGPVNSFTTVDAQVNYKLPNIKSMVKLGGTNIFNKYYKNAYANPSIGGVYYVSLAYNI